MSRGELIEIVGSFRLPDMMRAAGRKLIEVGTTNRTHLTDYERALGPWTALILKVHPSNCVMRGFTAKVAMRKLAGLVHAHGVPRVARAASNAGVEGHAFPMQRIPPVLDHGGLRSACAMRGDLVIG